MDATTVLLICMVVAAVSVLAAVTFTRRYDAPDVDAAMRAALAELRAASAADQAAMTDAALAQASRRVREQFDVAADDARRATASELSAKSGVIDTRLDSVTSEMRAELTRIGQLVSGFAEASAEKFGDVDRSLKSHAEVTETLSRSARALREAMASPSARGQWGERMAEDVLQLAGLHEHVNYKKQTQIDGGTGRPDFTFMLPKGNELYMDVKFPMSGYLKYLDADTDAERDAHRNTFLRDVRARVKELAQRDYAAASDNPSVDYVLLFLPNESLTGFIHQHDPELINDSLCQNVVMCSPLNLFAFLGVVRQAHDNYFIEQASDEILQLIGKFGQQWTKYTEQVDKVKTKFDQLDKQFDELAGTRRRQLEKPLAELDGIRRERNLPIDGDLFPEPDDECSTGDVAADRDDEQSDDGDAPLIRPALRRLGA